MCLAVRKIYVFFKLKQDFLQTGRNILPIHIMNDSSNGAKIKVIQLSELYLCCTRFSFINKLTGRNDFPHESFANTCCSSCFCYYSSCPKLWLISTFTLFFKILCDIQYYLLFLHTNRFPLFHLGHPGSGEMMPAIFQLTQKAILLGLGPHFIIDDIKYQLNSSVYVANGGHYYATLITIHIHLIAFDRLVYREIQLIALTLMISSRARAPELRMITRDSY